MTNILNIEKPLVKDDIELHILEEKHLSALETLAKDERLWKFSIHPFHQNNLFREKWLAKALAKIKQNS